MRIKTRFMKLNEILRKKKKRLLSIDFGQGFIKIAYLEVSHDNLILLNYDFKKISLAEEKNAEVTSYINSFLKENSILEKEAYLTISDSDSIFIKHLFLPAVPKEEILQAIKWQLKEDIPFNLENVLIDWQIVKEYTEEEGAKNIAIICILANRQTINKYLSIAVECNLMPVRVSSSPFNYAPILSYLKGNPPIPAVLDIGYKNTTLCIYNNNKLNFMRNLAFSSDKLTQSLTGTLISDKGKIGLSYEKAEEIKINFGIPKDETDILKYDIQAMHVISLMRPLLEGLVRELKRSFDYFSSTFKEKSPYLLYVTGGGANLKNIDWYLNKELNLNVSKLPLPDHINTQTMDKERLSQDKDRIMSVLGVALARPGDINLLPQEIKTQKIELIQKVSLRVVAITLGAIFLLLLFIFNFQIHDYKNRLRTAQIHLQTIAQIRDLKQKIDIRNNLIDKIQKNEVPVDGLLKLLSTIIDQNIVLNELLLDQQRHILILKGLVSISEGTAEAMLTNFIKRIEASPFFTEATLIASQNIGGIQEFEIKCDLAR